MSKFDDIYESTLSEVKLTDAMIKAFGKTANVKMHCPLCEFSVPKYAGRYPKKCPKCDGELNKTVLETKSKKADKREMLEAKLTDAMLKAFAKPIKFKDNCTKCGFSLPAYKGKYPKNCPSCNTDMSTNVKPDNNGKD